MYYSTLPPDVVGKSVLNGCGDLLGVVVRVVREHTGEVRGMVVRQQDGSKDWIVDAEHVKEVGPHIVLKGPREGFHIAPLPAAAPG